MYFDREYWKQMLPVVTAFANGEDVETTSFGEWESRSEFHFDASPDSYRIKPAPKLRHWISEELEDVICRCGVVRHKETGTVDTLLGIDRDGNVQMSAVWASAMQLVGLYELIGIDGVRLPEPKPCGVRE